jgi:ribonuclease P protein component
VPGVFPARQRVRKRSEFQRIQSEARRLSTRHFVLLIFARDFAASGAARGSTRLGITVTRRMGHAVARNRAKRLIREAFRETRGLFQAEIDVVVMVRRPLEGINCTQVVEEWLNVAELIRRRSEQARIDRDRRRAKLANGGQTTHTREPPC